MAKDIPKKVRDEVLSRDSFDGWACCIYCGRPGPGLHLHHVVRRSQGGKHEASNLVALCFNCHERLHHGDHEIQRFVEDYLRRKYDTVRD